MARWTSHKCNKCDFSFTGSGKPDALMRGRTIPVVCNSCKSIYDRIIETWTDEPPLGCKTCEARDYTEWDYEKKSCSKCVDGVIGEEEGGTITMAD